MADIKWIKLSVEMFDDEKIKLLEKMPDGDTLIVIWCKLLTMAGKGNHSGYIMLTEQFAYNDDMLVTVINRPAATVRLALNTFQQFGMLEFDTDKQAYSLSNWEKHQSLEGMEKIREQNRLRKAKQREKNKMLELGAPKKELSQDSHVTVTPSHAIELELELEKEKDIKKKPTRQQVDYSTEFQEFYSSYPRRKDKAKALKAYESVRKKKVSHEQLMNAVKQYSSEVKLDGREEKYIKLPASWLNGESYLDYEEQNVVLEKGDESELERKREERRRERGLL